MNRKGVLIWSAAAALGLVCAAMLRAGIGPAAIPLQDSAVDRIVRLWLNTKPVITSDARSEYTDDEYMKRGFALWDAWAKVRSEYGLADKENVIHDIVALIEDLYGREYSSPQRREMLRTDAKANFEIYIEEIERKIATLK